MSEFDIRQSETRVLQDQVNTNPVTKMDSTLASINSELTPVLRLQASNPTSLIVHVQNSSLTNPNTGINRIISPIGGAVPSFVSGTVTFPSSNGGNITTSTGGSTLLNCPNNDYVKVLIFLNSAGALNTICGTPNASPSAAQVPPPTPLTLPIGYVLLFNSGGTIQNVDSAHIYQFSGASSAPSPAGGFFTVSITLPYTIQSTDGGSIFLIDTSLGAGTLTLPSASPPISFKVKDIGGQALSNPITLARVSTEKIELLASNYIMEANYGEWEFVSNGTDWFITG